MTLQQVQQLVMAVTLCIGAGSRLLAAELPPAPGEEVMQPTRLSLRLTPTLSRAFVRNWMQDTVWRDMSLDPDQESRMIEAGSRRLMQIGHEQGSSVQPFIEYFVESMMATEGRFGREFSQELARRSGPFLKTTRDYLDGITEDARPILTSEQYAQFEKEIRHQRRALDRLGERMEQWAGGQYNDGDRPFQQLEQEIDDAADGSPSRSQEFRQAERQARAQLRWTSPVAEMRRFLSSCGYFFKLSPEQVARGEKTLAEYTARAEAIMTPEWKEVVRQNRVNYSLAPKLGLPVLPYQYRLDREYEASFAPLKDLTTAFRQEILALNTPEQKAAALAELQSFAGIHGATVDARLVEILGLAPSTQPQGAP